MKNLGDKIAFVAQPMARGIDAALGTNVAGCKGCKKMRENLNSGMSLTDAIYERWFKAKQKGEKMKYQIVVIIEADKTSEAVSKAEALGEVIAASARPDPPTRPQAGTVIQRPGLKTAEVQG